VEQLFALALTHHQREAFLREACGTDDELHREVSSLIRSHENQAQPPGVKIVSSLLSLLESEYFVGRTLGRYRVESYLGRGSSGTVFKATDSSNGDPVAIKIFDREWIGLAGNRAKVQHGCLANMQLHHPNIVRTLAVDRIDDVDFAVMEYIDGEPLSRVLRRAPAEPEQAIGIGVQICDALSYAHQHGRIHGDLKPANIMIDRQGTVKLLDFSLTPDGCAELGTEGYVAPERAAGRPGGVRGEVFSFGVILYELLAAHRFRRDSLSELPSPFREFIARCTHTNPDQRHAHIGAARAQLVRLLDAKPKRVLHTIAAIGMLAVIAIGAVLFARTSPARFRQLTYDRGYTAEPAVSPDGRWLAYSSNRAQLNGQDIWVQPLEGGSARRLTDHPADERHPAFSPDGRWIAFERSGDGICVMPSSGGQARLLAVRGHRPRFSPDGKWLLYWTGPEGSNDALSHVPSQIFKVPFDGGAPHSLCPKCMQASLPIWSHDGTRILFSGNFDPHRRQSLWVITSNGDHPEELALPRPFPGTRYTHFYGNALPERWESNDEIWLALYRGPRADLWRARLLRDPWRVDQDAAPLRKEEQRSASVALVPGDSAIFTAQHGAVQLWSIPRKRADGSSASLIQLTSGDGDAVFPSVTANGQDLVYLQGHYAKKLLRKSLRSGAVTELPLGQFQPRWAHAAAGGDVGILSVFEKSGSFVLLSSAGEQRKVVAGVDRAFDLSPDGRFLLFALDEEPGVVHLADTHTGKRSVVLNGKEVSVSGAKFSPDMRRIAFSAFGKGQSRLFTAPFHPETPITQNEWAPASVTSGSNPSWSPDGLEIYFVSDEDGFRCIWRQSLDSATRKPVGAASALQHLHTHALNLRNHSRFLLDLAASHEHVFVSMLHLKGDLWRASLK